MSQNTLIPSDACAKENSKSNETDVAALITNSASKAEVQVTENDPEQNAPVDYARSEQPMIPSDTEKLAYGAAGDASTNESTKSQGLQPLSEKDNKTENLPELKSDTTSAASLNEENEQSKINCTSCEQNVHETISRLEREIQERTNERDAYRAKLEEIEKQLSAIQESHDGAVNGGNTNKVQKLKKKLLETTTLLEDRGRVVVNQENQINALNNQVTTLKEVVACTKDLLQIRNTEVNHLQAEVNDMEKRITEERERHNTMIKKMDVAVRLNADLKKEYETQLRLFKDLRERYDEKVNLLSDGKDTLDSPARIK